MSCHGSPGFQSYSRTLSRLLWVEFIDAQLKAAQSKLAKAETGLPGYCRSVSSSVSATELPPLKIAAAE